MTLYYFHVTGGKDNVDYHTWLRKVTIEILKMNGYCVRKENEMEFIKLMKEYKRMCNAVTVYESCRNCNFFKKGGYGEACGYYMVNEQEYFEEVVKKWSEEHPILTNAMKLEEVFGCRPIISKDQITYIMCPPFKYRKCLNNENHANNSTCDKCREWWGEEYKEPEKGVEE